MNCRVPKYHVRKASAHGGMGQKLEARTAFLEALRLSPEGYPAAEEGLQMLET